MRLYKGRPKRLLIEEGVYFVTAKVNGNLPFFDHLELAEIFLANLKLTKHLKRFDLYAFALLPEHFHLLLKPNTFDIGKCLQSLKLNSSRDINNHITKADLDLPYFKWQKSFHSHVITSERDFVNHLSYIENNHLKHGLTASLQSTFL